MAAQELLKAALDAWSPVDLSAGRHAALDKQGLEIADNQEQSAAGRETLREVIREFRKVPHDERPARIASVIKAFQGFWRTTTNLSVQVATGLGDVTASAISELQNIGQKNDQYSSPKVDVDAEWSKPFVSSSPVKKPKELRFSTEDEPSEFSEFNYWCAGALAASTRAHPRAASARVGAAKDARVAGRGASAARHGLLEGHDHVLGRVGVDVVDLVGAQLAVLFLEAILSLKEGLGT